MTETRDIVLIDLSSLAYPIWHMSQAEPDPNHTSQQVVARVRAIASGKPHVAICCDSGKSFRHDLTPTYKATRPEHDAPRQHQITLAMEQLAADGFPVWAVKGFEADDVIASATVWAVMTIFGGDEPSRVTVVTSDKDLLQLVGDQVQVMNARDGTVFDPASVKAKFGVEPIQMRDYLTLVGDLSDNIVGAKGIGPKKAADLLATFRSLDALYEQLEAKRGATLGLAPALSASLREFKASGACDLARALVTLRTDVEAPYEAILAERVPVDAGSFTGFDPDAEDVDMTTGEIVGASSQDAVIPAEGPCETGGAPPSPTGAPADAATSVPNVGDSGRSQALTVREADILPAPAEWERQLDPRSMRDARILAKDMHDSRLFSAYGTPQGVLSTVMLGRELGLPAMASLRGIHIIEGRHALGASLMVALILKSGLAEYFRPVSFSATEATYETLRKGPGNNPVRLQHTIDMAGTAGLCKPNSNWLTVPTDMLVARASSRLARMVYPDIVGGLYTPDELAEQRTAVA